MARFKSNPEPIAINPNTALGSGTPVKGAGGGTAPGRRSQPITSSKGGLPLNPTEILSGGRVLADLGNDIPKQQPTQHIQPKNNLPASNDNQKRSLVEAQGWIINKDGQVVLTAQVPVITPHNTWQQLVSCQ